MPVAALHVATGFAQSNGQRFVVVAEGARVTQALLTFAAQGLDPDHLIAAPLLLPPVEAGFVAGIMGDETVVRGAALAFGDDAVLTPLLTGGETALLLDSDTRDAAIAGAVAHPEADLRHGLFARRRAWRIDVSRLRRLAAMRYCWDSSC